MLQLRACPLLPSSPPAFLTGPPLIFLTGPALSDAGDILPCPPGDAGSHARAGLVHLVPNSSRRTTNSQATCKTWDDPLHGLRKIYNSPIALPRDFLSHLPFQPRTDHARQMDPSNHMSCFKSSSLILTLLSDAPPWRSFLTLILTRF